MTATSPEAFVKELVEFVEWLPVNHVARVKEGHDKENLQTFEAEGVTITVQILPDNYFPRDEGSTRANVYLRSTLLTPHCVNIGYGLRFTEQERLQVEGYFARHNRLVQRQENAKAAEM